MKNVLIVNQSAELYGADKAILELIDNFPSGYNPIVVLHEEGPLKEYLQSKNIQVIKSSVIKVKRGVLSPSFMFKLPFEIIRSFLTIKKELKGKKISLVHSNATSVFIGAFYTFVFRIPHLWHVHEIIEKPNHIAKIYPLIVDFFSNKVVFNSKATQKHFLQILPKINKKGILIYNGQSRNYLIDKKDINEIRKVLYNINENEIAIGLIGRISEIKGQKLLFEAFKNNININKSSKIIFIGEPVEGKENYKKDIEKSISDELLTEKVVFINFQDSIWKFYDALDIIVVPSTEKESFGLVATEAMLSKKPVIAANHGGLSEIIIDNETGLFFEPNNIKDLSNKLEQLILSEEKRTLYGKNGFRRVNEYFSTEKFVQNFTQEYDKLTN